MIQEGRVKKMACIYHCGIPPKVTDMSHMFYKYYKFNGNVTNWDVSKVTTMFYMFYMNQKFQGDVSNWNVGKSYNYEWYVFLLPQI